MKTKSKKYKQLCKLYKKLLNAKHKEVIERPYDYTCALSYFEFCLEFMRDFYLLDEEVEMPDPTLNRFTSLLTATDAYNKYNKVHREYLEHFKDYTKQPAKEKTAFIKNKESLWALFWDTIKVHMRDWYD